MTETSKTNRRPARMTARQAREARRAAQARAAAPATAKAAPNTARVERDPDAPRSRSIRISDVRWKKAKRRAEREGATISRVAQELIEGYAEGHLNRPQMVFSSSATVRRSRYDSHDA